MFENFTYTQINTSEVTINLVYSGDGPPVLLLHGYPQTHVIVTTLLTCAGERCLPVFFWPKNVQMKLPSY